MLRVPDPTKSAWLETASQEKIRELLDRFFKLAIPEELDPEDGYHVLGPEDFTYEFEVIKHLEYHRDPLHFPTCFGLMVTVFGRVIEMVGGHVDGAQRFDGFCLDVLPILEVFKAGSIAPAIDFYLPTSLSVIPAELIVDGEFEGVGLEIRIQGKPEDEPSLAYEPGQRTRPRRKPRDSK